MRYRITHHTTYQYGSPVPLSQNMAHLTPREVPGQRCLHHRLRVNPRPSSSSRSLDYFGNPTNYFTITKSHRQLVLTATSTVEILRTGSGEAKGGAAWEAVMASQPLDVSESGLGILEFRFPSPHAPRSKELGEYARSSFPAGRPVIDAVRDLTRRIHRDFTYDPGATTVNTPVDEVFRHRRGVCQDLAHLEIAALRSIGLAARYVSGYLRTIPPPGQPRLVGADASHAWLAVHCGEAGWIDFDPTNDLLPGEDHVTIAWGRDYGDVCPVAGMFVGGGEHTVAVSVDVDVAD